MNDVADALVALLRPFLLLGSVTLLAMLALLIVHRGVDEWRFQRRQRIAARHRADLDAVLAPDGSELAIVALARAPASHRPVIESMLLKPLALATGSVVGRLRHAARVLGLIDEWARRLGDRRWWVRAEAARALGLVREPRALAALSRLLDDDHEEVRAAAVEALGLIGHPLSIRPLLARLSDESRHQRARIVEALREFGDVATPELAAHGAAHPQDAVVVADVLGLIGGTAAVESLAAWAQNERPELREAAIRGLGTIGLDEVGARLARHALDDESPNVRAAAARALGRARRQDVVEDLARHLDDEWAVAANCADALRRLGRVGIAALQARADDPSYVGDLARQMLWERSQAAGHGAAP